MFKIVLFSLLSGVSFALPDCKCHDDLDMPCTVDDCLRDPCGCCVCPKLEGETCSSIEPCQRDYICKLTRNSAEGVCVCDLDKRPVCAQDNRTYSSYCAFKSRTNGAGFVKWGHCDSAPEIVSGPSDMSIKLGDPIVLDCEAKGFPVPTINWEFLGPEGSSTLPSDDQMTAIQTRGGPETSMVTSWVQIVESSRRNQGLYTCVATNKHGTATSQAIVTA